MRSVWKSQSTRRTTRDPSLASTCDVLVSVSDHHIQNLKMAPANVDEQTSALQRGLKISYALDRNTFQLVSDKSTHFLC